MKQLVNIFCAAAVLLAVLSGCQKKAEQAQKTVDLRYRANDSYDLPAAGAQSFTILVASTDPWTVTSAHPDWCIISEEEGEGSDPEQVHTGKATPTTIRVQYYDNTYLDDREDKITIQSDYWVGKVITVRQKGIAFLTIPEADLDLSVEKAGGDYYIHIDSNQDWSSKVTAGEWISITEGATGHGVGTVTVAAETNAKELGVNDQSLGEQSYKGVDVALDWKDKVGDFEYGVYGNGSWLFTKVINDGQAYQMYDYLYRKGNPVGQKYGLEVIGIFQSEVEINNSPRQSFGEVRPGDLKYRDQNGDGVIDNQDQVKMFGTSTPVFQFGFGLHAAWKGFKVYADFQGVTGVTVNLLDSPLYQPLVGNGTISNTFGPYRQLYLRHQRQRHLRPQQDHLRGRGGARVRVPA